MRTGQPNTRSSCGIQAPLSHASRLDPHAAFPDTRSRSLNLYSVSKNVPDRNPLTSDCAYMLTPDWWESAQTQAVRRDGWPSDLSDEEILEKLLAFGFGSATQIWRGQSSLSSIDQDHERQRPVWGDDFARGSHQYTGGPSPIQIDGNIQV
jgi:hypothetical protein